MKQSLREQLRQQLFIEDSLCFKMLMLIREQAESLSELQHQSICELIPFLWLLISHSEKLGLSERLDEAVSSFQGLLERGSVYGLLDDPEMPANVAVPLSIFLEGHPVTLSSDADGVRSKQKLIEQRVHLVAFFVKQFKIFEELSQSIKAKSNALVLPQCGVSITSAGKAWPVKAKTIFDSINNQVFKLKNRYPGVVPPGLVEKLKEAQCRLLAVIKKDDRESHREALVNYPAIKRRLDPCSGVIAAVTEVCDVHLHKRFAHDLLFVLFELLKSRLSELTGDSRERSVGVTVSARLS